MVWLPVKTCYSNTHVPRKPEAPVTNTRDPEFWVSAGMVVSMWVG